MKRRFAELRLFPAASSIAASILLISSTVASAEVAAWFKADGIYGVPDGGQVQVWPDVSGNSAHAQAGNAPMLVADGINGLPVVRFDATQSQYLFFPRVVQDDFTMFVVFRSSEGSGASDQFYQGSGLVSGEVGGYTNDFGTALSASGRVVGGTGDPDTSVRSVSGLTDGNPHIFAFRRNRTFGAIGVYVDGLSGVTDFGASTQSLTAPPRLVIGAQQVLDNHFTGDIAEIIIHDTALSTSDREAVRDALRGKYGMAGGTAPVAPADVKTTGARVEWSESAGATGYEVSRATSPGGPYEVIASGLTTTSYFDTSAAEGGTVYYVVTAMNGIGSSSTSPPAEATLPVLPEDGHVIVNEIHYNGQSNVVLSDFIEFYNFKSTPTDLSGWRISSAIDYTFPPGTVMQPGEYLVVAASPATIQSLWGVEALGPYSGNLSSDGESIRLRDATNAIVCQVDYNSGFPWPCAANGEGASAELIHPSLDPALGSSWRASFVPAEDSTQEIASPGFQNYQFNPNPPPNIEEVAHSPLQPSSGAPIPITARVTDADGVAGVNLKYQILTPGNYLPSHLPYAIVNHQFVSTGPLQPNPAFEDPANWTTVPMFDTGTNGDAVAGDGIYTGTIPGQTHRTLVRYRIEAEDSEGSSDRAPFADDRSKNFACFVYNGVPDYQGIPASTLETLPTYHFLTRKQDYDQCVAYNSSNQLAGNTPSWKHRNWEAAIVFEGKVYDHIRYRLKGGNGRYRHITKRSFRFFFNSGYDFQNRENDGTLSPVKWNSISTENLWENRDTLTYSLNEVVNFHLWNLIGIPSPRGTMGHFRTIMQADEQPDAWHGDFWGMIYIHEDYDRRFLDTHEMEKGNLYKLTRDDNDGPSQQRYQSPDAVADGSDHALVRHTLNGFSSPEFVQAHVNLDRWSYYHALCQAVRHYDYWPSGDNNAAYYFEPDYTPENTNLGKLWVLPNDVDATWGPTWNNGHDRVYNALFDATASPGGDFGTNPTLWPVYFNAVREVRDLLWQPDQIDPLIDEFAAVIAPFAQADLIRWKGAPNSAGNYDAFSSSPGYTSLAHYVADMKKFAWEGGNWAGGGMGAGGSAAFLDTLQLGVSNSEGSTKPNTPTITYAGPNGHPINGLDFTASPFSDPQGPGTFAAIQWRIAEITDSSAPAYNPADKVKLEWVSTYDSGPLPAAGTTFNFPSSACEPGHAYRARVRYQDHTGRWSHWSAPVQFIAGQATVDPTNPALVISEFLYAPTAPTEEEAAAGFDDARDFEFIELLNVGPDALDLSGMRFTTGITFNFPPGTVLEPDERIIVARRPPAFIARYGSGQRIAGQWSGALDNAGERLVLVMPDNTPVLDFTYSDDPPWPVEADDGYSLVLKNPYSRPDHGLAESWRISKQPGGSPGAPDDATFDDWATRNFVSTGPDGDDDNDLIPNRLEYAFAMDPHAPSQFNGPEVRTISVGGQPGDYLVLTFTRPVVAEDLAYHVETSTGLSGWNADAVLVEAIHNGDGTVTQTWRAPVPITDQGRCFLRARVEP